jgi:hypothetical protein
MNSFIQQMIEKYLAAWNDNDDPDSFKKGFATCWADDATYTDENFENVTGIEGIAQLAWGYFQKAPVRRFELHIPPEHHHNVGRYTWKAVVPGATRIGQDFFEFNSENKITRLVSFFEQVIPNN